MAVQLVPVRGRVDLTMEWVTMSKVRRLKRLRRRRRCQFNIQISLLEWKDSWKRDRIGF